MHFAINWVLNLFKKPEVEITFAKAEIVPKEVIIPVKKTPTRKPAVKKTVAKKAVAKKAVAKKTTKAAKK